MRFDVFRALVVAAMLASSSIEARTMVEQFYIDHTGKRVSQTTDHSPIAYGPKDQMFFFLGHFGYVESESIRTQYPELGYVITWYAFEFAPVSALVSNSTSRVEPPVAVSEPGAIALFLAMLGMLLCVRKCS
jgi:cytochrome oxidase assembly protein ShyY1